MNHRSILKCAMSVLSILVLTSAGCALRRMNTTIALPNGTQIAWGSAVNGLQVGLEAREFTDKAPQFIGHLKNVGAAPLSLIDPQTTEVKWGVVVSLLQETDAAPLAAPEMKHQLTKILQPGEDLTVTLKFRLDVDRVPYSSHLKYTYGNQIPRDMPGLGTPDAPLWTGQAESGEIPIDTAYTNGEVYVPRHG